MAISAELRPIDEDLLERLTSVAVENAAADDVTPPFTAGNTWTSERISWFVDYHRSCREGLLGPTSEATWAVMVGEDPVGAVRLKRAEECGILEAGIWLGLNARGRGIASDAVAALLAEARKAGGSKIMAETTTSNTASLALLRAAGFTVSRLPYEGHRVLALFDLTDNS